MKILSIVLVLLLIGMQYKLWMGDSNLFQSKQLKEKIVAQEKINTDLAAQNRALEADIAELKSGDQSLEEQARYGLGMIKEGEVFYQIDESH